MRVNVRCMSTTLPQSICQISLVTKKDLMTQGGLVHRRAGRSGKWQTVFSGGKNLRRGDWRSLLALWGGEGAGGSPASSSPAVLVSRGRQLCTLLVCVSRAFPRYVARLEPPQFCCPPHQPGRSSATPSAGHSAAEPPLRTRSW